MIEDGIIGEINNFSFATIRVGEENMEVYFKANPKDDQKVKKPIDIEDFDFLVENADIEYMWIFRSKDNGERARKNILILKSEFPNAKFYKYGPIIIVSDGSEYKFFEVSSEGEVKKAEVIREFSFNLSTENKRLPDKITESNQIVPYKPSFWDRIFGRRSTNNQIQESNDKEKSAKKRRIEMLEDMHVDIVDSTSGVGDKSTEEVQKHNKEEGRT